jgi:uncharacterized membrane protein YkoI
VATKLVLGLPFCCGAIGIFGGESQKVELQQLPPSARQTINAHLGGGKIGEIEKETDDGEVSYTVQISKAGHDRELTLDADGTLLTEEISLEEAPGEVQKAVKAQVGQGKLQSIVKNFEDSELSFDIEMTTKQGAERSFSVAPDGKLTSVQISLEETPAPVRKTIQAHVGSGKLGDIYKLIEGNEISYDAEVDHNGKTRDMVVAPDGKLESMQVGLNDVTPEAQKTIKERIGNGKLLRIDKTFEGNQPYEIESMKDGKPFNFRVGPKGRFLGKD